jgi:acetyl esterase/lipase
MTIKSTAPAILLAFAFAAPPVRSEEKPDAPKAAEKSTPIEVPATRKGRIKRQDGEKHGARLEPTHSDVSYGDHIRHKIDVWLPEGKSGPVPVHVYFHGGGFVGGKKRTLIHDFL